MPPPLPAAVLTFVASHIRNLDELQLLMTIAESGDRWWDAVAASRELRIPVADARLALDHFASRNLLDIRVTDDVRYQFCPGTSELAAAARAAVDAYHKQPVEVARLIKPPSQQNVSDFADAFRIRRSDDR